MANREFDLGDVLIADYIGLSASAPDAIATSGYLNQPCRTKLECAAAIAARARDSLPLSPDARAAFDQIVTILDEVRR